MISLKEQLKNLQTILSSQSNLSPETRQILKQRNQKIRARISSARKAS